MANVWLISHSRNEIRKRERKKIGMKGGRIRLMWGIIEVREREPGGGDISP